MKKLIVVAFLLLSSAAWAGDTSILLQGAWLHTPSSAQDDNVNGAIRLEHPILAPFAVGAEFEYKGKVEHTIYGWMNGYGFLGELIFRPEVNERFKPYLLGGIGWYDWNFRESSYLQDKEITVDVDPSRGVKIAIGTDIKINEQWSFNVEWAYFKADIPKDSHYADGTFSNVVGGDTVGREETNLGVGLRYKW